MARTDRRCGTPGVETVGLQLDTDDQVRCERR
jgi:hypothetical protein